MAESRRNSSAAAAGPGRWTSEIGGALRALGTRERAEGEKRYLKSDLDFFGNTVWQIRGTVRSFIKEHRDLSRKQILDLADRMWSEPIFDLRLAAAFLLEARVDLLQTADLAVIKSLVKDSRTWALVDVLAGDVAGRLIVNHPEAAVRLDRWAKDKDFWVRRAALLAMLEPLKRGASFERFAGFADAMLEEKEFFIQKAIGWVLRDTSKRRQKEVFDWLQPRAHRASSVTMKEAVKYLEPRQRQALLARRPGRRSAGA